jgi:SAM-dependent methyltransferase
MPPSDVTSVRSTWEQLGRTDPMWAVLSTPGQRDGESRLEEFLATGRDGVAHIRGQLEASGAELGQRVLDFGCGMGRLSFALAELVDDVTGIDIAASMVEQADKLNREPERIRFVHGDGETLPFPDNSFDSAISLIVLQHAPAAVSLRCLLELARVVRPGGVLVFQVPSHLEEPVPLDPQAYRARLEMVDPPTRMAVGEAVKVRVRVTNDSPLAWQHAGALRLGNHWQRDGRHIVQDDGRVRLPSTVQPGETVELELRVSAPEQPGRALLELDLVHEHVTWWNGVGSPTTFADVDIEPAPAAPVEAAEPSAETPVAADAAVSDAAIEMHPLRIDLVRSLFEHLGATVLRAERDDLAGDGWISYTYVIRLNGPSH